MTARDSYTALLRLFPKAFREEYGDRMTQAFGAMHRERTASPSAFWAFVLADTARAAAAAHLDAWKSAHPFARRWTATCVVAAIVSGAAGNAASSAFAYLYHPYLEGFVIRPWSYGALLGFAFGAVQAIGCRPFKLGVGWIAATTAGATLGLYAGVAFAAPPMGSAVVLGSCVGASQWLALYPRARQAGWGTLVRTSALSLTFLSSAAAMHAVFGGLDPIAAVPPAMAWPVARAVYGRDVLVESLILGATGLAIGLLTAGPIACARKAAAAC